MRHTRICARLSYEGVQDITQEERQALRIKAALYKVTAIGLALAGMVIFSVLYFNMAGGSILEVLQKPMLVVILIFPFIPAAVLSWMAGRIEDKLQNDDSKTSSK